MKKLFVEFVGTLLPTVTSRDFKAAHSGDV